MNRELLVQIKDRVESGALKLGIQFGGQWFLRIDRVKLDMANAEKDILGQLYGGYLTGLDLLRIPKQEAHLFGFNVEDSSPDREEAVQLTRIWREKISLEVRAEARTQKRAHAARQRAFLQRKKAEAVQRKPLQPQPRKAQPAVHLL